MKIRYMSGLVIATALALSSAQSFGQDAGPPTSSTQREAMQLKLEDIRTRLALTPDQEAKIAPLFQARNEKLKALRDSSDPNASRRDKLGMLKEARGIQDDFVDQVEPLLTKEQKKEWEAIRKETQETAKARFRERRGE